VLAGTLAFGLTAPVLAREGRAATENPKKQRPQPGDTLVYAYGDNKGELITPDKLPLGGPQELAFPMEPKSGTIRDGSRLNQILVVRLDPDAMSEQTRSHAADGVVAYSAVCTHQGCPISMWGDEKETLFCSCHASQFDPRNNAEVVDGPAPRRLAILPLEIANSELVVAGEFQGRIGFQ
jgi:rieske iron-sulfur protein